MVRVPLPDVSVTIQEIYDQIQDWLDEPSQMDILHFVSAGGKESLGGSEFVGITMTLSDDWRIEFEARPGPSTISCQVSGGNLVAVNSFSNNPIKPSAFTQVQIRQSSAPTIVEVGVSGLTAQEAADLALIQVVDSKVDIIDTNVDTILSRVSGIDVAITLIDGKIDIIDSNIDDIVPRIQLMEKILRNRTHTDPTTGIMTVYDDNDTDVLFTAQLFEDVAAAIPYTSTSARIDRRNRLV